jgi:NADH-quinone oxidoreductase subunit L
MSSLAAIFPFIVSIILTTEYLVRGETSQEFRLGVLVIGHQKIPFTLFIDHLTLIILMLTGYLSVLVNKFSHTYLHRERDFQHFFMVINLFIFGLELMALAGSLDWFFAGWEIIGLSSFLLIGFYHERTRSIRNAFKVFSIYRLCDVGLLFGAILTHLLLKEADHFYFINNHATELTKYLSPQWQIILFLLLLLAALGKSAQFPFINWPSRAMEGPTPSSAIFYGALSIHCGVFLLYRTYPLYQNSFTALATIFCIGIISTILATGIGRVQTNIKGQIASASVAQIGIMLTELALGLHKLLLFHIVCHALQRSHQILTSPSAVVDHIKTSTLNEGPSLRKSIENLLPIRLRTTLYSFLFQEAFLSISERGFFPLPVIQIKLWARRHPYQLFTLLLGVSLVIYHFYGHFPLPERLIFAYLLAIIGLFNSFYCLLSLDSPPKTWNRFLFSLLAFIFSHFIYDWHLYQGPLLFAISALPCWVLGWFSLKNFGHLRLTKYNGLTSTHQLSYRLFMIAFLGLAGYPFTTIFWAEDLIFDEILLNAPVLLFLSAIYLTLNGFIAGRIMVKTYWGFPGEMKY